MKTLLTIAGFDPSSGAGVTADLAVFAAHRCFGVSAITALTVQSTLGVRATHCVGADVLRESLACLVEDLPPAGVKIGMLGSRENVAVAAAFLRNLRLRHGSVPVVLDPVLRSSSGRELLSVEGLVKLREELLPLVDWVTPNRPELSALTDLPASTRPEVEAAVVSLTTRYPGLNVVATGGDAEQADDLVFAGERLHWLCGEKIVSRATHGTGCAFSSALLCQLVLRRDADASCGEAKRYVTRAIELAPVIGHGAGPMNLLWPLTHCGN